MSEITDITATLLRRKLRPALKSVEAGARVRITRHNKVVAALIGPADYDKLTGNATKTPVAEVPPPAAVEVTVEAVNAGGPALELPPEHRPASEKLITTL